MSEPMDDIVFYEEAVEIDPAKHAALIDALRRNPHPGIPCIQTEPSAARWITRTSLVWNEHGVDITRPRSKAYRRAQWNAICVERGINNIPDRDGVYRRAVAYWHQIARMGK